MASLLQRSLTSPTCRASQQHQRGGLSPVHTALRTRIATVSWPPLRLSCDPPSVRHLACHATDPDNSSRNSPGSSGTSSSSPLSLLPSRFNPAYLAIFAGFAALFALRNPYIFAVLTIAFIIPQNSTTTSLNSLVLFAYDTGIFMNFGEAVYCVRLLTWLSIVACLASFALFY